MKTIQETRIDEWNSDSRDFDNYFRSQKYSLGAMPTWTQIEEMRRTWCNSRRYLRNRQQNIYEET